MSTSSLPVVAVCAASLLACWSPTRAAAVPVPDAATIAALAADLRDAQAVRVTGSFGTHVLRDVRLDPTGIAAAAWGPGGNVRPALFASNEVLPPERPAPIAWSDIARIEKGERSTGRFAIGGLLAGALLGSIVWRTIPLGYDGGRGSAPAVVGIPAATGFALGAILGSQHYRWRVTYPR